jgi:hypothetical protein
MQAGKHEPIMIVMDFLLNEKVGVNHVNQSRICQKSLLRATANGSGKSCERRQGRKKSGHRIIGIAGFSALREPSRRRLTPNQGVEIVHLRSPIHGIEGVCDEKTTVFLKENPPESESLTPPSRTKPISRDQMRCMP